MKYLLALLASAVILAALASFNNGEYNLLHDDNNINEIINNTALIKIFYTNPVTGIVREVGSGSGVYISPNLILTVKHVVAPTEIPTDRLSIGLDINNEYSIEYISEDYDFAIISTEVENVDYVKNHIQCSPPELGEEILGIGNSYGIFVNNLTWGYISKPYTRDYNDPSIPLGTLLTSMKVAQGQSGGPIYNDSFNIVGLISAYFTNATAGGAQISYMVSSDIVCQELKNWLDSLPIETFGETYMIHPPQ